MIYEVRAQNYDPEIHEEYLIHDTPTLPYHYYYRDRTRSTNIKIYREKTRTDRRMQTIV